MFRFRLEKVLRHRQRLVDIRGREAVAAELAVRKAEARVAQVRAEIAALNQRSAGARSGAVDPRALQQDAGWQDELHRRLQARIDEAARKRLELTVAHEQLQAAWRDREVLARLRQRHETEWRQEESRRQQRELDEIAGIRAAIQGAAGDDRKRLS